MTYIGLANAPGAEAEECLHPLIENWSFLSLFLSGFPYGVISAKVAESARARNSYLYGSNYLSKRALACQFWLFIIISWLLASPPLYVVSDALCIESAAARRS